MNSRVCIGTETLGQCHVDLAGQHGRKLRCDYCAFEAKRIQRVRNERKRKGYKTPPEAPVAQRRVKAVRKAPLCNLFFDELCKDPLAKTKVIAKRLETTPNSISDAVRKQWFTTIDDLRREAIDHLRSAK